MAKCKYETKNGRCGLKGSYAYRRKCYAEDFCRCHEPQTNADRIRAMSDEELATILGDKCICPPTGECTRQYGDCIACWLEWLKQPAEEIAPNG